MHQMSARMKNKFILLVSGIVCIAILLFSVYLLVVKGPGVLTEKTGRLQVVVSFYPLEEFSRQVGGREVDVTSLIPAGVEPHDFEPTARDIVAIHQSDVFVYNGAGFEPWIERTLPDIQKNGVVVVNSSENIDVPMDSDPHIWLDPVLAHEQVDAITEGFITADPQHASIYEANATAYKKQLADLDTDFRIGLSHCATRSVVVSHEAFRYVARRYNLHVVSLSGISPDEEPSPQKMAEIVEFAKKNNIRYIFFETLVSPRLSETIAKEIGAEMLVFNPLEGLTPEEIAQGKNYISVQQENLANLEKALGCI